MTGMQKQRQREVILVSNKIIDLIKALITSTAKSKITWSQEVIDFRTKYICKKGDFTFSIEHTSLVNTFSFEVTDEKGNKLIAVNSIEYYNELKRLEEIIKIKDSKFQEKLEKIKRALL